MKSTHHSLCRIAIAAMTLSLLGLRAVSAEDSTAKDSAGTAVKASRAPEKGCTWKKLSSETPRLSLVSQECDFGFRKITHLVNGSKVVQKYSDSPEPDKVIEVFSKEASDSPAAALKKLFIDKLDTYEQKHCVAKETKAKENFEKPFQDKNKTAWLIEPDKEYLAKIRKNTPKGDMPAESCGEYGAPVDSRAYFEFHAGSKTQFAWVLIGQDTPLFDEQSIDF